MNTLTIIDTFGFFFRSFYALPPLKNKDGFPTGLLVGFCNLLQSLYKDSSCNYIIFALEGGGENKRRSLYAPYKRNRNAPPEELIKQLPIAIEWIKQMGFLNVSVEGYEADDVIASISKLANAENVAVRIISHDKDLYQLIGENIYIYDPINKKDIKEEQCLQKYGVLPQQFIDYQSLVGDVSDNIVGIKGIGAKSAQMLISHFGNIENLYHHTDELEKLTTPRIAKLIIEGKESAFLSKKLVKLYDNLLENIDLSKCIMPESNPMLKIISELEKYDLKNILSKVVAPHDRYAKKKILAKKALGASIEASADSKGFSYKAHLIDSKEALEAILDSMPSEAEIAFDCESDSLNVKEANLVGFSFCFDGKNAYYVPVGHHYLGVSRQIDLDTARNAIAKIFTHTLIGHNLKFDLSLIFCAFHLTHKGAIKDSMILAWLYDSIAPVGLDKQMLKWFNHTMISFESVLGTNENFSQVNIQTATQYAAEDAAASFCLLKTLEAAFIKRDLGGILEIAKNLEYPFIKVLMAMEMEGIKVNLALLESLKDKASEQINQLSQKIFALCGENFNLNSPPTAFKGAFPAFRAKGRAQCQRRTKH